MSSLNTLPGMKHTIYIYKIQKGNIRPPLVPPGFLQHCTSSLPYKLIMLVILDSPHPPPIQRLTVRCSPLSLRSRAKNDLFWSDLVMSFACCEFIQMFLHVYVCLWFTVLWAVLHRAPPSTTH